MDTAKKSFSIVVVGQSLAALSKKGSCHDLKVVVQKTKKQKSGAEKTKGLQAGLLNTKTPILNAKHKLEAQCSALKLIGSNCR